jgi:hypothetical protein
MELVINSYRTALSKENGLFVLEFEGKQVFPDKLKSLPLARPFVLLAMQYF